MFHMDFLPFSVELAKWIVHVESPSLGPSPCLGLPGKFVHGTWKRCPTRPSKPGQWLLVLGLISLE